jgi:hypothetical protein
MDKGIVLCAPTPTFPLSGVASQVFGIQGVTSSPGVALWWGVCTIGFFRRKALWRSGLRALQKSEP